MSWVRRLLEAAARWWRGSPRRLRAGVVEELPAELADGVVYLEGEVGTPWFAALRCPCGCGAEIRLSLLSGDSPSWRAVVHDDGTISLRPSIRRTVGCHSHFWVTEGTVVWCRY